MKTRISKVTGLLEKKGIPLESEFKMEWPEKVSEIPGFLAANDISEDRFMGMAWRGYTLSFQGSGESLSEEEKEVRKVARKEENSQLKALRQLAKDKGIPFADLLKKMVG